ncbi:DNA primase [Ramlibacter sp. AW1]|uniref:DNA primase n=1 Tax=Ramlibacter aurantiacus TaxID=2801330 RepID=A0A936ZN25_9BURK|nr:DNA primase [Ramlibacter aurantiacus]MBL0420325.1 DNA primase [Ramlibacter aurantiacus]
MAIPETFIQELLARADVVEIVGRYVPLKKTGANFSGLCPFHAEKSPSFTVSPSKQFFHCFGCGKHGNAIGFLMEHTGMGFIEAVKDLAGQFGLQVPEDERSPQDQVLAAQQRQKQSTLTGVLEKAAEAYRQHLKQAPRAVAYLKNRGLSGEVARRFGLGYAPEGWRTLAGVFPSYDDPVLAESGLVIVHEEDDKRYDRFRDRIMFPIRNVKGECIGFGGRVLGDEKPKYLNSPETPVFSKGRELYGLFEARQALREHGFALVTEGYMDVVALAQLGFPNAVATLGTACTTEHVQKLFRFTDSVVFSFDGDAAGRRAARKALDGALPFATDLRSVKFLFLPPEHDPDSYVREHGHDAFARYIGEAAPLSRFLVDSAREGCDLSTAEGRAHMVATAKPLWIQLPDGALKRQLLGEIADLAQLDRDDLSALWTGRPAASRKPRRRVEGAPPRPRPGRVLPLGRADRILQIMLTDAAAWERLSNDDHHMLCELSAPHGPLLAWLDARMHEHGPEPWDALQAALQGHEHHDFAVSVMTRMPTAIENDPAELAHILQLERERRRAEEMKELSLRAASDPAAYERLKQLVAGHRAARTS